MAGQIPQRFIDDLLGRVDVVEVVGERVQLKTAGRNFSGLCPFHQEKTPSFTVSADKQFYHCFGCGALDAHGVPTNPGSLAASSLRVSPGHASLCLTLANENPCLALVLSACL